MLRIHRGSIVVVAIACFVSARSARADEVRDAVEAGNRAFVSAFLRGDSIGVSGLYTVDAQVIAPGSAVAKGRPAIAAFWQKSIDSGIKDVALETAEVESDGALAYETGNVRLVAADGSVSRARYVVIWKRIDGKWLLHRDIWNASE